MTVRIKPGTAVRTCWSSVWRAARWSPGWFAGTVIAAIALALVPAVQVRCIAALGRGPGDKGAASWILVATALTVGATYLLSGLLQNISQTQRSIQQNRFMHELRRSVASMSPAQLAQSETSRDIQAAVAAVDYTLNGLATNTVQVIAAATTAASLLISLWSISWLAGVLVVASLLPLIAMYWVLAGLRREVVNQMSENVRQSRYFTDQLIYQRTATELSSLGTSQRMAKWADEPAWKNDAIVNTFGWRSMLGDLCSSLAITACVIGALMAMYTQSNSPNMALAGVLAVMSGIAATRGTGSAIGQIILAVPLMEAYDRVVTLPSEPQDCTPHHTCQQLHASGLIVSYPGKSTPAITGADLTIREGEMVAIVGSNGAGKTTLVNALMGLTPLSAGEILIDNVNLGSLTDAERVRYFGMLTQEFGRYELTVRQSLLLASPEEYFTDDDLWRALDLAKAREFVAALPHGLDTQLGQQWDGVGISGGQWQRLALARIYLRDAAIWVLDEPTSAIDAESERAIFDELSQNRTGHITIVVSHRASTLVAMDCIYVVDNGRIVQRGTYNELLSQPGRFKEIFYG